MDKQTRIKEIMDAYKRRSEQLFEANLDTSVLYLSEIVHRDKIQDSLRRMRLAQLPVWVDSGQAKEHMKKMYPMHTSNFDSIFYEKEDEDIAKLTRACVGMLGLDFDKEARDLKQYLEAKLDLPKDELVDDLIREKGIYAARAVIGDVPRVSLLTGPSAMIEYVWMRVANDVCTNDLRGRNKDGIDISGYDGWLNLK